MIILDSFFSLIIEIVFILKVINDCSWYQITLIVFYCTAYITTDFRIKIYLLTLLK